MIQKVGKYRILERVGRGGMGVVYKAHDPMLDRLVAIKVISSEGEITDELKTRFYREAQACARLIHPNIVVVHELGEDQGRLYIVMEFLDGEELKALITKRKPLAMPEKLSLMSQVCDGLHYAHQNGVIHRDIKPGNIFILRNGQVKILDFGIARIATTDSGLTRTGLIMGTPRYMSPEQARGKVDHRSDMFSAGTVFYELLSGKAAFDSEDPMETLEKLRSEDPTPLTEFDPTIPEDLVQIVEKALKKNPDHRFPDMGQMRAKVEQVRRRIGDEAEHLLAHVRALLDELRELRERLAGAGVEADDATIPVVDERTKLPDLQALERHLLGQLERLRAGARQLDTIQPRIDRATQLLEAGDAVAAIAELDAVLRDVPEHRRAQALLEQAQTAARDAIRPARDDTGQTCPVVPEVNPKPYLNENVQFTVYRPKTVESTRWCRLFAFAHLSERRPDAPADEPDPIETVQQQVRQLLGTEVREYQDVTQDSLHAVPAEGEITFVPEVRGVEFNPLRRTFIWRDTVHREEFWFRASAALDGQTARGRLTVFLGSFILAEVSLAIRVDGRHRGLAPATLESAHARRYRRIFASYSHKDLAIVTDCERYARALGDEFVLGRVNLRAGEVWSDRLQELIEQADIFQLFWSHNSMRSPFVRQEWEYALSLGRPTFVRPTYWEDPFPESSEEGLPPNVLRRLHFYYLPTVRHGRFEEATGAIDAATRLRDQQAEVERLRQLVATAHRAADEAGAGRPATEAFGRAKAAEQAAAEAIGRQAFEEAVRSLHAAEQAYQDAARQATEEVRTEKAKAEQAVRDAGQAKQAAGALNPATHASSATKWSAAQAREAAGQAALGRADWTAAQTLLGEARRLYDEAARDARADASVEDRHRAVEAESARLREAVVAARRAAEEAGAAQTASAQAGLQTARTAEQAGESAFSRHAHDEAQSQFRAAERAYQDAARHASAQQAVSAAVAEAERLIAEGQADCALEPLARVRASHPKHPELAKLEAQIKRVAEERKRREQVQSLVAQGRRLQTQGELARALRYAEEAVQLSPADAAAIRLRDDLQQAVEQAEPAPPAPTPVASAPVSRPTERRQPPLIREPELPRAPRRGLGVKQIGIGATTCLLLILGAYFLWPGGKEDVQTASVRSVDIALEVLPPGTPERVAGQVTRIDGSKATIQSGGQTYQFQFPADALKDLKVGNPVEARLTVMPAGALARAEDARKVMAAARDAAAKDRAETLAPKSWAAATDKEREGDAAFGKRSFVEAQAAYTEARVAYGRAGQDAVQQGWIAFARDRQDRASQARVRAQALEAPTLAGDLWSKALGLEKSADEELKRLEFDKVIALAKEAEQTFKAAGDKAGELRQFRALAYQSKARMQAEKQKAQPNSKDYAAAVEREKQGETAYSRLAFKDAVGHYDAATELFARKAPDPPAPPPPPVGDPVKEIWVVLENYKRAIEGKDITLYQQLYPGVSRENLRRIEQSFQQMQSQSLDFRDVAVDVTGDDATAKGRRFDVLVPKGGREIRNESAFVIRLRKTASGWVIQAMTN